MVLDGFWQSHYLELFQRYLLTKTNKIMKKIVLKDHQIDGESFDDFLQHETPFYMKKALEFRHLSR